ncbi:hypothetical protein ACTWP5_26425 [Streptomyces sp. 4N509B]|uniref:hypothetical protein n=1 Tax=Streptomyces sp. 4N509B TaxID=3457413 RepID=UPI003FCF41A1
MKSAFSRCAAVAALAMIACAGTVSPATAQLPAVTLYSVTYKIDFSQPGDAGSGPEPYGYVRLDYKDGGHVNLWEQTESGADTLSTYGPVTTAPLDISKVKTISADVDEDDNIGDDEIGYGTKDWAGKGEYTFTEEDGSTTLTIISVNEIK